MTLWLRLMVDKLEQRRLLAAAAALALVLMVALVTHDARGRPFIRVLPTHHDSSDHYPTSHIEGEEGGGGSSNDEASSTPSVVSTQMPPPMPPRYVPHHLHDSGKDCKGLSSGLKLSRRDDLGALAEELGYRSFVEVGVQRGVYAETVLSRWPSLEQYCGIDLWAHQDNYVDQANVDTNKHLSFYRDTQRRLGPFGGKVTLVRDHSSNAVSRFADNSVDVVYLDARHDYSSVTEDIKLYWPKVKPGGLLAGHDFIDVPGGNQDWTVDERGVRHPEGKAVRGAVEDFAQSMGLEIGSTCEVWPSWYIKKPVPM
jgi:hypothetical protein